MAEQTAREQRNDERRRCILAAARKRADVDGWSAVTTRHLAAAIGYTQPVLYGHFPGGKAEIMLAIALEGFVDFTRACRAALGQKRGRSAIEAVATAYLDFGDKHPAIYDAMFQQPIDARFASDDTRPSLRAAFQVLSDAVADQSGGTTTEVFWGTLHGISLLERSDRMRSEHRAGRIAELGQLFTADHKR